MKRDVKWHVWGHCRFDARAIAIDISRPVRKEFMRNEVTDSVLVGRGEG